MTLTAPPTEATRTLRAVLDTVASRLGAAYQEHYQAADEAARWDAIGRYVEGRAQWRRADRADLRAAVWREAYDLLVEALDDPPGSADPAGHRSVRR